jgi:hypothetical protein
MAMVLLGLLLPNQSITFHNSYFRIMAYGSCGTCNIGNRYPRSPCYSQSVTLELSSRYSMHDWASVCSRVQDSVLNASLLTKFQVPSLSSLQ